MNDWLTTGPPQGHLDSVSTIATLPERLEKLLEETVRHALPQETYDLMWYLSHLSPLQRLVYNLKTVLWLMRARPVDNPLKDGLSYEELAALMAIDGSNMSLESRRTAHSLLDIEARLIAIRELGGMFKDRRRRAKHMLKEKPLDN